jgi:phosphoglycolate phosphatase
MRLAMVRPPYTADAAPVVVFDLDGTLVDTARDLVATLNVILAGQGLPPITHAAARTMVGGGARALIERRLVAAGRTLGKGDIDRLVEDFITHYAAHISDHSHPFPGLELALDRLADRGYRFAVCTNKLEWLSVRLLDMLGLSCRFAAICGTDTYGLRKPDPEFLRRTISRAGGSIDRAVMVGDSITDVVTARAAAVPIIAVDYGYTEIPVAELRPDRVINALSALPEAVYALLGTPEAAADPGGNY